MISTISHEGAAVVAGQEEAHQEHTDHHPWTALRQDTALHLDDGRQTVEVTGVVAEVEEVAGVPEEQG